MTTAADDRSNYHQQRDRLRTQRSEAQRAELAWFWVTWLSYPGGRRQRIITLDSGEDSDAKIELHARALGALHVVTSNRISEDELSRTLKRGRSIADILNREDADAFRQILEARKSQNIHEGHREVVFGTE